MPFASRGWRIFAVSVLALFLEMLLIRWIGAEIHLFAYVQNTILVACFLGLGLGCFTCRQPVRLRNTTLPLLFLLAIMAVPQVRMAVGRVGDALTVPGKLLIWSTLPALEGPMLALLVAVALGLTWVLLVLIVDLFVPLGRLLGALLNDDPRPLRAYSINVAASLAGVWLFVGLSALWLPPVAWFAVAAALLLLVMAQLGQHRRADVALVAALLPLAALASWTPGARATFWSPYQKLVVHDVADGPAALGEHVVTVNNTGYQVLIDLSEARVAADPGRFPPDTRGLSQYDLPLLLHPAPRRFLVVGAGTGNDAAGGVRNGATEVTAVEIDRAIIRIGEQRHPERPYASPRVRVVSDDARSFFATADGKFDVIAFGLLDSHTTTAMTNARLDHYVYTRESLARARSLLAEHGVMVLTFEVQKPFIADRMARLLTETFGAPPLAFRIPRSASGWGGVMFVAGDLATVRAQLARDARLAGYIERLRQATPLSLPGTSEVPTDDWPYVYLESRRIPPLYFLLGALMLLLVARSCAHWDAVPALRRWQRTHWHFFCLGAAFLLLEVQNISKASVVLGNTWETNAAIVSGVLVMALAANGLVLRWPRLPAGAAYALLLAATLGLYFVDLARFAHFPYGLKVVVVGALAGLPVLFSGIVFARSFAGTPAPDEALGANIVGAVVGALLQSVAFVTGIKALLLIVAAFYALALLTGRVPGSPPVPGDRPL